MKMRVFWHFCYLSKYLFTFFFKFVRHTDDCTFPYPTRLLCSFFNEFIYDGDPYLLVGTGNYFWLDGTDGKTHHERFIIQKDGIKIAEFIGYCVVLNKQGKRRV